MSATFPVNRLFLDQLEESKKDSDNHSITGAHNESRQRHPMADRTNNLGDLGLKRRRSQDDCYVPQNASPHNFSHAAAANIHSANVSPQEAMVIDTYQNRN